MEVKSRPRGLVVLLVALATLASLCFAGAGAAHAATARAVHPATADTTAAVKQIKPPSCDTPQAPPKPGTFPTEHCDAVPLTNSSGYVTVQPEASGPPSTALGPTQIQSAYDLPAAGTGETVAIVDAFGYATAEADLGVFRSFYNLPACTTANGCFKKVDENGGTDYPPEDSSWSIETALDLDAVSSACPKCNIVLVEADTDNASDLAQSVETAANLGATAISNSYGGDEAPDESSLDQYYNHPGIAVTVSAGDTGYGVSYPSVSPYVTSVGGTALTQDSGSARGWDETVWNDENGATGSGCSAYEPQPAFQKGLATDCPDNRADTDISADAAPATGLGIYNSTALGGWSQYGGTSLSSPLIAAMYALAGTPTPGTYPVTYPYADPTDLNDVTSGDDGDCGDVLCQAGPGWDGPTGLGTPNGIKALSQGPSGQIAGKITDSSSGAGISGVDVTATAPSGNEFTATTGADGGYDLYAPAGTYTVTATDFGYPTQTVEDVTVTDNESVAENFTLAALPRETVSGYVTDGSGHGWPMRAKITISGYPGGAVYSDPYTGKYSVALPSGTDYTMQFTSADLSGYLGQTATVDVSGSAVRQDIQLPVDASTCTAPGYAYRNQGTVETFTGWQGTTAQDGWSVVDNIGSGQTWNFANLSGFAGPQGSDSDFASVQSDYWDGGQQDTSLISPAVDLSGQSDPQIMFDNEYIGFPGQTGTVDLSLDGGETWNTVFTPPTMDALMDIPIPQAAGQSDVRVRFHFIGGDTRMWQIDNVLIGTQSCVAQPGGLVAGVVTDANTGDVLEGATVTSASDQTQFGVTAATPDDAGLTGGYYWLYSSHTGQTGFTVTDGQYADAAGQIDVIADGVVHQDFKLDVGRLTVGQQSLSATETLGAAKTKTVTLGNDGTAPLNVSLGQSDAGFTAMGQSANAPVAATPKTLVKAHTSLAERPGNPTASPGASSGTQLTAPLSASANGSWTSVANYPTSVMDDVVADYDGKIYVVGGSDGNEPLQSANVFDPATGAWSAIADLPEPLSALSGQFIGGTLYVTGGWNWLGETSQHTYAYNPGTNTWSQIADLPLAVAAAASAVVDGKLYIIGGCTTGSCAPLSSAVYSYDPGNNSWSAAPAYPSTVAFVACGGVDSAVVCAGGESGSSSLNTTYAYTPGDAGWTQKASMPDDAWGAAAASANGQLEVMGGAVQNGAMLSNQNYGYDPTTNLWSALPNSANALYRGGAACGIYEIGGEADGSYTPVQLVQYLPGYDQCAAGTAWLSSSESTLTIAPGQKVAVTVTADSSKVSQPGTYKGELTLDDNSPYASALPVTFTMTVNPPKTWGKITGTVSDTSGGPIVGATVAICTMYEPKTGTCGPVTYTLQTDGNGNYQLWLDKGFSPLEIIAAKDGYTPVMRTAKVAAGSTTTLAFTLNSSSAVTQSTLQTFLNSHLDIRSAPR
ncbi:carboxypeptidase regulatory-like domain-containing protein [Actinospica durhamensis]|uniref:Carboxypeptidase regulatory-like domain-containing protein n=1 Tax=Actinospica durhamensis TaxID=1508375 RepID=A0A941ETQ8_9ACTN|nr:carboxypeptidase regulatory-like domain-containing protein [Actinospica durhamensis]MBR7837136.1 carboxypeptidase regulatory-like domain-containing protein [Actinospica durhamensis]